MRRKHSTRARADRRLDDIVTTGPVTHKGVGRVEARLSGGSQDGRQFEEVDKRFDKLEARFDKLEARFDKLEALRPLRRSSSWRRLRRDGGKFDQLSSI
jgi:hypothetical protein